jgi:predicted TIM-barrel fold metal-dependent hydrolase
MKIIALEEHFWTSAIAEASQNRPSDQRADLARGTFADAVSAQLADLGEQRLRDMDASGIDMQVLSYTTPGTQNLPPDQAVPLARDANDQLAAAIAAHPDRLAGFATLPTPDPEAAARELERGAGPGLQGSDDQWAHRPALSR